MQHTYQAPGSYTVTLTLTDAQGNNQVAPSLIIIVDKGVVQAYPSHALARFNFTRGVDNLQFTLTVPQLVYTPQQARDAIHAGAFEGNTYTLQLNGAPVQGLSIILDRRASFKSGNASFKLNLVKGQIIGCLKAGSALDKNPLVYSLGLTNSPTDKSSPPKKKKMKIEIVGDSTVYSAVFTLSYTSNGKTGTGTSP